jgi:hypothetical protein
VTAIGQLGPAPLVVEPTTLEYSLVVRLGF